MRARLLRFWRWKVENRTVRLALGTLCAVSATALFIISPLSVLTIFLSYGLPPCTDNSAAIDAQLGFAFVSFVGAIIFAIAAAKGRPALALIAVSLTAAALAVLLGARAHDDHMQAACKAWTIEQAMVQCRADPAHYRIETHPGQNGLGAYRTLNLISPDRSDAALQCLGSWSYRNDEGVGIVVDEAAYASQRQTTARPTTVGNRR